MHTTRTCFPLWTLTLLSLSSCGGHDVAGTDSADPIAEVPQAATYTMPAPTVAHANAAFPGRRNRLLQKLVYNYLSPTNGGLRSFKDDGSKRSFRRMAAALLSLKHPEWFTDATRVPIRVVSDFETWTGTIATWDYGSPQSIGGHADYDMTMKDMITFLYMFKDDRTLLTDNAAYNIVERGLSFYNAQGLSWPDQDISEAMRINIASLFGLWYSETENHVLMILSSQYLANQWLFHNYRNDSRLAVRQNSSRHANPAGGTLEKALLHIMGRIVHADYFETNSRAYQSLSVHSLFNLYAFADSPVVRAAAKNALDYTMARFAFQSLNSKRFGPHRRNWEYTNNLDMYANDHVIPMAAIISGAYDWPDQAPTADNTCDTYFLGCYGDQGIGHALWAALISDPEMLGDRRYELPVSIHDFMLNKHNGFWTRAQGRFTDNHYRKQFWPRYFYDDEKTPYLAGAFQRAPEFYFVTPYFMNVAGGNHQPYPLQTSEVEASASWWPPGGSVTITDRPGYDFWARPTAVIPAGHTGRWGDGDANAGRNIFNSQVLNMSSKGDLWWYGQNLGVYKNFAYGSDPARVPQAPGRPFYTEGSVSEFPNANGQLKFRFQEVLFTSGGTKASYYVVLGNAGIASGSRTRYFWEIIPKYAYSSLGALKSAVLTRNSASGLSADRTTISYVIWSGEKVSADPEIGAYPIKKISNGSTDLPLGQSWYDSANPVAMPLLEVQEVNSSMRFTGIRYAETPANGLVYIWNPWVNSFLIIDSTDPLHPTRDEHAGPPLRNYRSDVTSQITPGTGSWGSWKYLRMCPPSTYAIGYRMRVEPNQSSNDDSCLNAVELLCSAPNGLSTQWISSDNGYWGVWNGTAQCANSNPSNLTSFLRGARMLIEPSQGGGESDDTAANDVEFSCTGGANIRAPGGRGFGSWTSMANCPTGSAVCGIQSRFEEPLGPGVSGADDTAMNGMKLVCCSVSSISCGGAWNAPCCPPTQDKPQGDCGPQFYCRHDSTSPYETGTCAR